MTFSRFQATVGLSALAVAVFFLAEAIGEEAAPVDVLRSPDTAKALAYQFTPAEEELLEDVQRGCFQFFWKEVGSPSGLAKDRRYAEVSSIAGVGFQLASLPIGVEHGWITRAEGEARARQVLDALKQRGDEIHRHGVYLHFVRLDDGGVHPPFDNHASTVDHALLLAGALPAAEYFGGEVARAVAEFSANTNWRAFVSEENGYICFGWDPDDNVTMTGPGKFKEYTWHLATDEERLIYFMAVGAPTEQFAVDPGGYYRLERHIERYKDMEPFVVAWNGIPFQYFFSHLYIDYRNLAADDPGRFGVEAPRVDWFENSRRATLTHRARCLEVAEEFPSFGPDRWGVSPCMGFNERGEPAYLVQDVEPNLVNREEWHRGTVAPYAAGSSIMFTPQESVAALRAFRELKDDDGRPLVWRDPADGGYALADSYMIPKPGSGADRPLVSDDNVAIDVGPMLVAIENARTGLIWRLFMQHADAQRAVERLGFTPLGE